MKDYMFLILVFQLSFVYALPTGEQNPDSAYFSTKPRDLQQTRQARIAALSCSSLGVVASLVAFYWFYRMDKLFRHR